MPAAPTDRPGVIACAVAALRCRVLGALPGRVAAYGHAVLRKADLAALGDAPVTLVATNDLSRSGAPLLVLEMARALRDAGHRVVVLSPVTGPFLRDLLDDGFRVLIDPAIARSAWLDRLAARTRLAVCNTVDTAGIAGRMARAVPVLWYLHEVSLLEQRLRDPAVADAVQSVQRVWAGSRLCADVLQPVRPDAEVVPYGIEALPDAPVRTGGPLRVGVFGSIESRKGQDLVVAAVGMLPPDARAALRVDLYGRMLEPEFAREVLSAVERDSVLRYRGELDRAGYVAAMRDTDAVLVSSRDDTLPLVSIDALGIGRMLLLVPSVGTGQWLHDGTDVLIAAETSAVAIRDLLLRALALRTEAERFATAAKGAFAEHFSPEAFRARLAAAVAALEVGR